MQSGRAEPLRRYSDARVTWGTEGQRLLRGAGPARSLGDPRPGPSPSQSARSPSTLRHTRSSGAGSLQSSPNGVAGEARRPQDHTRRDPGRPPPLRARTCPSRTGSPPRWRCGHHPPVQPVARAEGDDAAHLHPAATARLRAAHRLAVPHAPAPPLQAGGGDGGAEPPPRLRTARCAPTGLQATPCGWAPPAGLEAAAGVPCSWDLGTARIRTAGRP